MFASQKKKTVTIKDDAGEPVDVVIRKLSAWSIDEAREIQQATAARGARAYGAELVKAFRESPTEQDEPAEDPVAAEKARYAQLDRRTVLQAGIESWAGQKDLAKALKDIDQETADLLHREIVDLSLPPAEVREAAGKDSAGVSASS